MKKNSNTAGKAIPPTAKKMSLKAPVKATKATMPRIAANHNETLAVR
jgi:hypothetical protein